MVVFKELIVLESKIIVKFYLTAHFSNLFEYSILYGNVSNI